MPKDFVSLISVKRSNGVPCIPEERVESALFGNSALPTVLNLLGEINYNKSLLDIRTFGLCILDRSVLFKIDFSNFQWY